MTDLTPLLLSLATASGATLAAMGPAVGLGHWLARSGSRWVPAVHALVHLPAVAPPVVTGWVLLRALGRHGLGPWLEAIGLPIAFAWPGAVVAAAVVGFPFAVSAVRVAFEGVDRRYEEVAMSLGLRPWAVFRRVTLPLAGPGLAAGAALAFTRGLGEFGATIVLVGESPSTRTVPVAIYGLLGRPNSDSEVATLALASLTLSALGLAAVEWLRRRR